MFMMTARQSQNDSFDMLNISDSDLEQDRHGPNTISVLTSSEIRSEPCTPMQRTPRSLNGEKKGKEKRYSWFIYIVAFVRNVNTR
jgi:hypothetical protein